MGRNSNVRGLASEVGERSIGKRAFVPFVTMRFRCVCIY
ncbi:hypothetical protein BSU04_36965 [Caballeronia sordidicola]|uniref:Uncharacterized protein n=1 Tax=Caballeronia sordidicola TaxID=196367 RepID=A0A226WQG1_CABSO|nr:hypothetical protein BSU04_36965 [Caballeronia sordidicola]